MRKKERAALIVEALKEHYPASCSLVARKDYELLFATRLSAQCTDARVNVVTKELFSRWDSLEAIAGADLSELMEVVKPCGLYRVKAMDIQKCAQALLENHGGKVPDTMEELLKLPGVGRKTANVVAIVAFHQSAMPVDTHVFRVSDRLGLTTGAKTPLQTEMQLTARIPAEDLPAAHHWLILHGRYVCTARKPHCEACGLKPWCRYFARSEAKSSRPQRQSQ